LKIKRKELYKALPKEINTLLQYIGNKFILKSENFNLIEYNKDIITKAHYYDGLLGGWNEIVWYYDYNGFYIYVNGFRFNNNKEKGKIGFYYDSDTLFEDILEFSLINDFIDNELIINIDNQSKKMIKGYFE